MYKIQTHQSPFDNTVSDVPFDLWHGGISHNLLTTKQEQNTFYYYQNS